MSLAHNGASGRYEVCLDGRKVRTPLGNPLTVEGEALARAVQQEWQAQGELVLTQQMHLTGLCNASVDNPTGAGREELADEALKFLETDTVLFFSSCDNEALARRQEERWRPVVRWFSQWHGVQVEPSTSLLPPQISPEARGAVRKYLLSHSLPCLHALSFGTDAAKSLVLMCAVVERRLTVEEAVALARLEVELQTERWGAVEWSHDLELHDTTARIAAAALFVQLTRSQHLKKGKSEQLQ